MTKDDLISRQAAIDVFRQLADDDWNRRTGASWADGYESAIEILEDIPVAQERKKGRWELAEDGWYCSSCKLYPPFDCDPEEKGIPFCPNCGADMRPERGTKE